MNVKNLQKKSIRQNLLRIRNDMGMEDRASHDIIIRNKLQDLIGESPIKRLALYYPIGSEVDLRPIFIWCSKLNITTAIPVIAGDNLHFIQWRTGDRLSVNSFGVPEPIGMTIIRPDAIVIPLLAFDDNRMRLGYGGGFYDRTLPKQEAVKIGVAYSSQRLRELPHESHDVQLDLIVTEQGITE